MKRKKLLAVLLASAMTISMAACGNDSAESSTPSESTGTESTESSAASEEVSSETPAGEPEQEAVVAELKPLANKEYGTDYVSLYSQFGKETSIADVIEDEETGFAYIERDGVRYQLGLDFLSMAMVYNTAVPEGGVWETEDDVYANWWKLYMQRWNYMMPEVPLYSNEYYDMYNAQIKGVAEHPTNPYWGPEMALIDWTSEKADNSIIIGNVTEMSGKFRYAAFGGTNPNATDLAIQNMTVGMQTVATNKEGGFEWNTTVLASEPEAVENADGSKTYTIKIKDNLKFSDGSPVTAKDYLVFTMVFSSPVAVQAAGKDHQSGRTIVGFKDFNTYTGPDSAEGKKTFAGLRMIDDYTFSVTIDAAELPYFYDITYAGFSAYYTPMWIKDVEIKDDGEGVYFSDEFYTMSDGEKYDMAAHIEEISRNTDTTYPYSGPYVVESYDVADSSAVLKLNPEFPGNYEGVKPSIETVVYKLVVSATQLVDLQSGGVDVLSGITGGNETNEAVALADGAPDKYVYTHYSRAGYGKLGFRADFGSVQFTEVRQAIAYCMDRAGFAKEFTGGYGGVVDGPYYTGSWMYQAAVGQGMMLDAYSTSVDSAIAVLEEGGWVYDAEGNAYTEGVRYKQIPAAEMSENDKTFQSKDGAYKTTQVGDYYYMPLVLNWYGTTDNPFTDQLMTGFASNENIKAAGFEVQYTVGEFNPMLDELYQAAIYGYYSGTPLYTCFNFATGFTSAAYDFAYNLTIDPAMYDDYSQYYVKDEADAYWLN
ncbi:ABC transporter substrate-binding protein [Acetatifactor muris]|uniref:ABC transporter substrate-binding protein n=1 Tax=Acetatifactor muris TaxID=879566 RepID=UPI0023F5553B|nr:ABC transporter substrate-binding protein [Acetatifactor muris]